MESYCLSINSNDFSQPWGILLQKIYEALTDIPLFVDLHNSNEYLRKGWLGGGRSLNFLEKLGHGGPWEDEHLYYFLKEAKGIFETWSY